MSGPWDRPSSPNPDDDQDWPAEDLGASTPSTPPGDPWSSDDPWQQQPSDATPSWDVWPSPAPPPDDYVVDEPMRPSSDPWAETWTDDDVPEPASAQPSHDEPPAADRSQPADEPRITPWAADDDPWAASESSWTPAEPWKQEPAPELAAAPDAGPAHEPDEAAEQAEHAEPAAPTEASEPVEAVEPPVTRPFARPSWPPPFLQRDEPADAAASEPDADAAADTEDEPEIEPEIASTPEPTGEPAAAFEAEGEPDVEARPEAEPEFDADAAEETDGAPGDVLDRPTAAAVPLEDDQPDDLPAMVDRVESAPAPAEPVWEPDLWDEHAEPDAEAAEQADDEPGIEPAEQTDAPEADERTGPEADESVAEESAPWPASFAGTAGLAAPVAADLDDDRELDDGHDLDSGDDLPDEAEPWPVRGEPTQVFPTSWTPPQPMPREHSGDLEPEAGAVRTSLAGSAAIDEDLEAKPTTAEQAVPWLIGVILLLAGMVIVLLALIFAGDASLGGAAGLPSESIDEMAASMSAAPSAESTPGATPVPSVSAAPTPTPAPAAQYGALEVIYQGRSAALAPIYLLDQDFTTADGPTVLAQDATLDVRRYAWAPDGTVGAALLADVLVSIEPGAEKRRLGEDISTLTFGDDASTVYAVRVTEDGGNDVAAVLAIDFLSGDTTEITSATYARPDIGQEDALAEAQFADDGGSVRIYWTEDDQIVLWSLGAGAWSIDPESGELTELAADVPVLWSPNGERRIVLTLTDGTTTIALHEGDGEEPVATTALDGRVSHVRWAPSGDRVIFTLGRLASGGGILQDLMLWDLEDGVTPTRLTSSGAAFGVEWRGGQPLWRAE